MRNVTGSQITSPEAMSQVKNPASTLVALGWKTVSATSAMKSGGDASAATVLATPEAGWATSPGPRFVMFRPVAAVLLRPARNLPCKKPCKRYLDVKHMAVNGAHDG